MEYAVIPARGGSKRVPRKNVRPFHGKPMLAYSIEAAKASGVFDGVYVSTDDDEIREVAKAYGVDGVFDRHGYLAGDQATIMDVMQASAYALYDMRLDIGGICYISATAPLIRPHDIAEGLKQLKAGGWQYAFGATEFGYPVHRSFKASAAGGLEMLFPEHFTTRSQDLPTIMHDAAQFCWGTHEAWNIKAPVFSERSTPVMIPRSRVLDIDTEEDWEMAERLYAAIAAGGQS